MTLSYWSPEELAEFMDQFRPEALEHVRALDEQLLKLEREPGNPAPIREMFLSAHTIKGAAGMLELNQIRELAHAMEDVLSYLRDNPQALEGSLADMLFKAVDWLRDLITVAVPGQGSDDPAPGHLAETLRNHAQALRQGIAPAAMATPAAAAEAEVSATPPAPAGPARVLLVEESTTMRMLETMLLEDAGFEVDAVADGGQALTMAQGTPYAIVATSIETRGLRGLDLAARLRDDAATAQIPIILLSSDDNPAHRQQAADLGVTAYIRKGSFGQQRLVSTVRDLTGQPAG